MAFCSCLIWTATKDCLELKFYSFPSPVAVILATGKSDRVGGAGYATIGWIFLAISFNATPILITAHLPNDHEHLIHKPRIQESIEKFSRSGPFTLCDDAQLDHNFAWGPLSDLRARPSLDKSFVANRDHLIITRIDGVRSSLRHSIWNNTLKSYTSCDNPLTKTFNYLLAWIFRLRRGEVHIILIPNFSLTGWILRSRKLTRALSDLFRCEVRSMIMSSIQYGFSFCSVASIHFWNVQHL
jgi:hypothetical protein